MDKRFKGQGAVITGGSRGIGRSIVNKFVTGGAKVAILDIDEEALQQTDKELKQIGYDVLTKTVDIVDFDAVEEAIREIHKTIGSIDILVNNAGIIRDNLLFKMTNQDWTQVLEVHLQGSFNTSRAVQRYMVEQQYGRIINISSTSALGKRGQANYATAKAGIQGFTKTLAIELGKFGITANAVAPGFIETDMTKQTAERLGISFEALIKESINLIPVNRSGKPVDVAHTVAFFADEKSSFINGQVIYVAGGPKN